MEEIKIIVNNGQIRFIYDDDLINLMNIGDATISRASFVEPKGNKWLVDLSPVNGPKLGPYKKRATALEKERKWLVKNDIPQPN
ncbi:MAG: hypothetical protein AABY32_03935 [Nanoarchaeota archaeon]